MLKFLIIANVLVTNICCILFVLLVIDGYEAFKSKHPDFHFPKELRDSKYILGIIKLSLMAICPIFNILFMLSMVIEHDKIIDRVVNTIEEKYNINEVNQ